MRHRTASITVLLSFVLLTVGFSSAAAQVDEDAGSNGIVFMVHGHFEPAVTDEIPPPPAQEAFATTQQDGEIVLYVIPYSTVTEEPTAFGDDTTIAIEGQLSGQSLIVEPRTGTTDDQRCIDETTITDHKGDVSDCLVVEIDASEVRGWGAVEIELRGTHLAADTFITESYSSPAHVAIHTTMEDGAPGFDTADQLSAASTPFLVEDLVDPVS